MNKVFNLPVRFVDVYLVGERRYLGENEGRAANFPTASVNLPRPASAVTVSRIYVVDLFVKK